MAAHKELFETLVGEAKIVSESINKENKEEEERWKESYFFSIRKIYSNKRRGKKLSDLMLSLIKFQGFDVKIQKKAGKESTVFIIRENDGKMQVKTSMLLKTGKYTFQQIRKTDKFDALIFFGVSPQTAHWWVVNREVILDSSNEWIKREKLNFQHSPIDKLITFDIKNPPQWLTPLGGTLDKGLEVFKKEVERLDEIKQGS